MLIMPPGTWEVTNEDLIKQDFGKIESAISEIGRRAQAGFAVHGT